MNVETTILNGKKYMEIDKIEINNIFYVFLSNLDDEDDFCIRKLSLENGKIYYNGLDDEKEFNKVFSEFAKKNKNFLEEEE